jgi:predicted SnoaL-like aldol condensation-catalyzing enzyme
MAPDPYGAVRRGRQPAEVHSSAFQLFEMENDMTKTNPEQNKALVLEAFDTLFNKRDYEAAASFWSESYIQHSAHIKPGRDGLFDLIRSAPETLRYERQLIVAEGDYVIVHGRFTGTGRPVALTYVKSLRNQGCSTSAPVGCLRDPEHWTG